MGRGAPNGVGSRTLSWGTVGSPLPTAACSCRRRRKSPRAGRAGVWVCVGGRAAMTSVTVAWCTLTGTRLDEVVCRVSLYMFTMSRRAD